jgi:uncharacterized protein (TIGR03086 family)
VSENLRLYTTVMFGLEQTLARVPSSAWDHPSPCAGWTVREVAGHAMGVTHNIAARVSGGEVIDAFTDVSDIAGDDPVATFRTYRTQFLEATDRRGALQTPVASRVGDMTSDSYMAFMRSDTFIHTWDIARGAGIEPYFDPHLVSVILADYLARDMTPLRVPQRYDEERAVTADADELARLIAFTGRDPEWSPS